MLEVNTLSELLREQRLGAMEASALLTTVMTEIEVAVFAFDENVTQVTEFSDRVAELQTAVRKIPPGAGTSIYDAVVLGSRALLHDGAQHDGPVERLHPERG